ncbi:MAG: hypothetical protein V7607_2560 [Solirubrobacteraceae bacterium]
MGVRGSLRRIRGATIARLPMSAPDQCHDDAQPSRAEQLLLKDYDNAAQLTYHIDGLRDRVTVFFVTMAGIAAAGLSVVLKDQTRSALALDLVAALFLLVAVLGLPVVLILARLRAVQLEHFRILSKIRSHFYGADADLWNTVELSATTLPQPSRGSGTYMWLSAILLVAAFSAGVGAYFLAAVANDWVANGVAWVIACGSAALWALVLDLSYFQLASPPPPPIYDAEKLPSPR